MDVYDGKGDTADGFYCRYGRGVTILATAALQATFGSPTRFATGARSVLVNGVLAIDGGRPTGAAAGRALPHRPPPGSRR